MDKAKKPRKDDGKVKPSGKHLNWSDEELDELATITDADIADAKRDAAQHPDLDALLNADEDR